MNLLASQFLFTQPHWLLLLIPALTLLLLRRGRGADTAVSFPNLSVLVSLGQRVRKTTAALSLPLAWIALVAAILAMARPVLRDQQQNRTASGIDIVITLDVSMSMDIDDFVDQGQRARRIDVARQVVADFIDRRPDDRIGLVVFAGRPRNASPITLDHQWLKHALEEVRLNDSRNLGTVKEQGTAIGSAIATAALRLKARDAKSRIIVLITDGASNSDTLKPVEAAKYAKTLGVKIYTIAVGTTEGRVDPRVMPFPYQEFDLPTLREIASLTGAEHYWAQNLESLKQTFSTIDQLEKTEAKSHTVITDSELFPWPLSLSVLAALGAALRLALRP